MHEDILKKLEQKLDRRSFLRGSSLAAAAAIGSAVFPVAAHAQNPAPAEPKKDEKKDEKPGEKPGDKKDAPKEEAKKEPAPDPFKETKKDEQGRDYRMCPQCGYNMYKQERTWTCENCGYSYAE
jgi:ribosomal protein S27AE